MKREKSIQIIKIIYEKKNGLSTAGLVLSILAIIGCWIPFLNIFSIIMAIVGFGLSFPSLLSFLRKKKESAGNAIAASILCILSLIISTNINYSISTKSLNCTLNEIGKDNLSVNYTIEYLFKGEEISKIESTSIIEVNPEVLENTIKGSEEIIKNMALYDGFSYNITKEDNSHIKGEIKIDYSKINVEDLRTKYGDDYIENDMYLNYVGMPFNTIKDSMTTAGYTCK